MPEVQAIGEVWIPDREGRLSNPCGVEKIHPRFSSLLQELVRAYREVLGESLDGVYLRGSVPRGRAVQGVADLDSLALVRGLEPEQLRRLESDLEARVEVLEAQAPEVAGIEALLLDRDRVLNRSGSSPWPFLLATQGLCLAGVDRIPRLGPMGLADAPRLHLPGLKKVAEIFRSERADDPEDLVVWASKQFLRAGFELVLQAEGTYTRDLYPCWEGFARHHPEKGPAMRRVLEWALAPPTDLDRVQATLDDLAGYLSQAAQSQGLVPDGA